MVIEAEEGEEGMADADVTFCYEPLWNAARLSFRAVM